MPIFILYKHYPNSPLATCISVLSSVWLVFSIAGIVLMFDNEITGGIVFVLLGIGLFFLFRFWARRIAERKAAKEAAKIAKKQSPDYFAAMQSKSAANQSGTAQCANSNQQNPSANPASKSSSTTDKAAKSKKKRRGTLRKVFGVLLLIAPVLVFIGRKAGGGSGPDGFIETLGYYGALIGMVIGGINLLTKDKQS